MVTSATKPCAGVRCQGRGYTRRDHSRTSSRRFHFHPQLEKKSGIERSEVRMAAARPPWAMAGARGNVRKGIDGAGRGGGAPGALVEVPAGPRHLDDVDVAGLQRRPPHLVPPQPPLPPEGWGGRRVHGRRVGARRRSSAAGPIAHRVACGWPRTSNPPREGSHGRTPVVGGGGGGRLGEGGELRALLQDVERHHPRPVQLRRHRRVLRRME